MSARMEELVLLGITRHGPSTLTEIQNRITPRPNISVLRSVVRKMCSDGALRRQVNTNVYGVPVALNIMSMRWL